ncbi:MAG: DUF11 domain-containing protein [Acidobacteria bacterium]|uniref:DUF11 domain-containing protein n=1 Tax=Candidatus Polarisedimenticola svalbardensis TaxID=2886004 RepID=A0A8J7CFC0_9BACT|nr:DUF11 domain-containing protein [Candidatus Polarisedimenticola svalbardensis]
MFRRGMLRNGLLFFGILVLLGGAGYLAVHDDGLFELGDGSGATGTADIVGSDTQPGCDWAELFDADPTPEEIAQAAADCGGVDAAFTTDPLSIGKKTDSTVFVKGSAKNDSPISEWRWNTGNSPSKDDLTNFYAYATLDVELDLMLYTGVERLNASGDSHIDFEFNQVPVTLDREAPCDDDQSAGPDDGAPCEFDGERTEGDLLVNMNFKKGGDFGSAEIRRWDGTAWLLSESVQGEGCNDGDTVCAFNNGTTISAGAWISYNDRGQPTDSLDPNAFTEVGINVTALLGRTPCFVNVQAKSRSSASFNSSLKDFARASIGICSFTVSKDGNSPENPHPVLSKIGDDFTFHYELENTGGGTLYIVEILDSHFGDITQIAIDEGVITPGAEAAPDFALGCSILKPEDKCEFGIATAVPDDSTDPFDTSVSATYSDQPTIGQDAAKANIITVSDSDDFPLNLFQPSIDVSKTGDTLSTPGNVVDYLITVVNTGSLDSPDLVNGYYVDSLLGVLDETNPYITASTCGDRLPVTGTCTIDAARTVLPDDPDPLGNTVDVSYNPEGGFPNVIADSASHEVDLVYPDFTVTITVEPEAASPGELVTYTIVIENTGDVDLNEIIVSDTLLGDLSDQLPDTLGPGETATVVVSRYILPADPNPLVNETTATYQVGGLPNEITVTASFSVEIVIPCAKSPGFWKGGEGRPKWDDILSDPVSQEAGFQNSTPFPWVDGSLLGTTYLGILELPANGDVTRQLSFKYVAARLNQAAFGMRASTALLLNNIDLYLAQFPVGSNPQGAAQDQGQALKTELDAYFTEVGESNCPPNNEF